MNLQLRKMVRISALLGVLSSPGIAQSVLLQGTIAITYLDAGSGATCEYRATVNALSAPGGPTTWAASLQVLQAGVNDLDDSIGGIFTGTVSSAGPLCGSRADLPVTSNTTLNITSGWNLSFVQSVWSLVLSLGPGSQNPNENPPGPALSFSPGGPGSIQVTNAGFVVSCSDPSFNNYGCGGDTPGVISALAVCLSAQPGVLACPSSSAGTGPSIASLSPSSATAGGVGFPLAVNGSNFASGATVQWNGANLPTTFVSSTQLTATVSASLIASAGTASVTVSSGGQTSPSASFTISPKSSGGSTVVVVTKLTSTTDGIVNGACVPPAADSSFTTTSSQVWLYFGVTGVAATDTTQINWAEPNGAVYETENSTAGFTGSGCFAYHINVSGAAPASSPGTWTIQVLWDNSSLFSLNFTIASSSPAPAPTIATLSPTSSTAGASAFTLTVNGANFVSGATVQWNGTSLPTTVVSSAQLTASVSANLIASAGTASITISSGGQISAPATFTIAAPIASSVPTLITDVISNTNGIVNNVCTSPASVTSFTTASSQVWITFSVTGAAVGNSATINFLSPGGALYQSYNSAVTSVGSGGYECFSYGINISGAAAASYPGTWTIQALWNQSSTPLFALNFALASATPTSPATNSYYFPHLAFGGGWQTTLTYVSYSPASVNCQTTFYSDAGGALQVPFTDDGNVSTRSDNLAAGADIHVQTNASTNAAVLTGWAQAQCTAPVKASVLYRLYNGNVAQGEAGVNAVTAPATEFVSFAQTETGLAWANPSSSPANVTVTVVDTTGKTLGAETFTVQPNGHGQGNIGPMLGLGSFTGSAQVESSVPILTLLLNAEAFPVFSSLPPADLPSGTPLAGSGAGAATLSATTYYLPHLAFGGGWQTTLTYVNYSPENVSCHTTFYSDSGGSLQVPFTDDGAVPTRVDNLAAGADIHVQTNAAANAAVLTGWAQAQCTGPVKASLLYRDYAGSVAQGEAGVNATTAPTTEFVTFAQTQTGIAYANPSSVPATVTIAALDSTGAALGKTSLTLGPNAHGAANIGPLLGIGSFNGSVQITSTAPIVSLSLNAEVFPVFSSLPPGDLPAGTALAMGTTAPTTSATVTVVSGNLQAAMVGQAFSAPLVVQVTDSLGNPVSTLVTWTVSQGSATLSNSSASTNAAGQASTTVTAGPSTGMVLITAAVGSVTATFSLTVAASVATGQTQVTPGQTLTITGSFNTSASVTTAVVFSDNAGFSMSVTPLSVVGGSVSVLAPPYFNTRQGLLTSGAVTMSVVQQPSGGQSTATTPVNLQIAALPQTGVAAGTLTLAVLNQLIQAVGTASQTWATIQQESGGLVQASRLNLSTLQSNLSTMQSQIQALMSGTITQACLGQINGQNVCLNVSGLALLDQLYYAFYLGSTTASVQTAALLHVSLAQPRDLVSGFSTWYAGLVTSTLPQTIRANANTMRTIVSIAVGVATLAAGAEVVTVVVVAAAASAAITWASAATSAALEGAGSEILKQDTSDYNNTIGIIEDGSEEYSNLQGSVYGLLKDEAGALLGEAGEAAAEILEGVESLLNPDDPNSVASETATAASENLFNAGSAGGGLSGAWTGSYTRTPSICPSYSGQLTGVTLTVNSDGTIDGSVVITNFPIYDSNCMVTEIENDGSVGSISGNTTGTDSNGNITWQGSMYDVYNDLNLAGFWMFTATLSNGTISGVFSGNGGTFTLHR